MTFNSPKGAKVTVVSPKNLAEDVVLLGEIPLTVDVDTLEGKIIRVSQTGKLPYYWIFTNAVGENIQVDMKLASALPGFDPKDNISTAINKAATNRILRLMMLSYKALAAKRFDLAKDLADQATMVDPELAAPLLIKGIALMQEGDSKGAKLLLTRARALDPEDRGIDQLIKALP